MPAPDRAIAAVDRAARSDRRDAAARWHAAVGARGGDVGEWVGRLAMAGRLTLNLHPDRIDRSGRTVAEGLLADGRYRSQWVTGLSNGSRSAFPGGDRSRWERRLFGGAYDDADPVEIDRPVYGALDLLHDPHGGSPRFGSCFAVLDTAVLARTTLCVGDSHQGPRDVGTIAEPFAVLAGLAEQAAAAVLFDRGLGVDDLLALLDGADRATRPGRVLDGYVEAQVHGGVDLRTDVTALVIDPSFVGTTVAADLVAAAQRYGIALTWHGGSELPADAVPAGFRGPDVPVLARRVARADGIVDAAAIGRSAGDSTVVPMRADGDPPDSPAQQLKYLWHVVLAFGHDAVGG